MPNPNPYQARLARAQKRRPGDIDAVRRRTWGVLCLAYSEIADAADADERRKAILAYGQIATLYARVLEASEIEARICALEQAMAERQDRPQRS